MNNNTFVISQACGIRTIQLLMNKYETVDPEVALKSEHVIYRRIYQVEETIMKLLYRFYINTEYYKDERSNTLCIYVTDKRNTCKCQ